MKIMRLADKPVDASVGNLVITMVSKQAMNPLYLLVSHSSNCLHRTLVKIGIWLKKLLGWDTCYCQLWLFAAVTAKNKYKYAIGTVPGK